MTGVASDPVALYGLGMRCLQSRRPGEARRHLEAAAAAHPRSGALALDIGEGLLLCGGFAIAEMLFRQLLKAGASPRLLCDLGEALGGMERHDEAAECFRHAARLMPDNAQLFYNLGMAMSFAGRMTEAEAAFARAAELAPQVPSFRRAHIASHRISPGDPDMLALEQIAADLPPDMPDGERIELHFALAKAYDDLGEYDRAAAALAAGNALKRRTVAYDEAKTLAGFDAITKAFPAALLDTRRDVGVPSDVPVFVVGMPRSGTSLVEQILASHADVYGAGESVVLFDLIRTGQAGRAFPEAVEMLSGTDWRRLGEAYLAGISAGAPGARRIVDKLPLNFAYLGVIRLALPGARIVHVRRHAADTCFSCYAQLFEGDQPFAYDLGEIGRYYRAYDRLMAHWRKVLPAETLLEIDYEELVEDFEAVVRRLVAFCGLEWDARCLSFHRTRRTVRTASAFQVRRPLYRNAVGRADAYRLWLQPLYTELERNSDDNGGL